MAKITKAHGATNRRSYIEDVLENPNRPVETEQADEPLGGFGPDETRPSQAAPKADWVAYARAVSGDFVDVESVTKAELIATYGRD